MRALEDTGVPLKELQVLNPVRLSQQVLYLSDESHWTATTSTSNLNMTHGQIFSFHKNNLLSGQIVCGRKLSGG